MNKPTPSRLLFPLILIAVAAGIVYLAAAKKPPEVIAPVEERPTPVQVQIVEAVSLPDIIELTGRLAADEEALLATEKPGLVRKVHVDQGVRVKKNDLLLELDSVLWTAATRKSELELAEAERDLARWRELSRSGAVATTELDRLQTRRDLAAEQVVESKAHVDKCFVRSPADGWIDQRFLSEGEFAPEGEAAYRFVRLDPIKVRFDLPERDARAVQPGQSLTFSLDDGATRRTGTVSFVALAALPENNAFRVELTAPNPDETLKPGMIVRVAVVRRHFEKAIQVPLGAVVPHKDVYVTYVVKDGKAVRRVVKLGGLLGDNTIVEAGLQPGDRVVVEGNRTLSDGSAVRVIQAGDGAAP
jgi:RND family efflux transporter MFP subunit